MVVAAMVLECLMLLRWLQEGVLGAQAVLEDMLTVDV
jgi:hypothetical protein